MQTPMIDTIVHTFRQLSPERHPLLARLTRDDVYDRGRWMAPGGLLLAHQMAERLALAPGSTVTVGGTAATVTYVSDTELTAGLPLGLGAGVFDVTVSPRAKR